MQTSTLKKEKKKEEWSVGGVEIEVNDEKKKRRILRRRSRKQCTTH